MGNLTVGGGNGSLSRLLANRPGVLFAPREVLRYNASLKEVLGSGLLFNE